MEFLVLDSLFRRYPGRAAVDGISLTINRGEIFSLLGPSGCGKTTLLRLIAGLDQPDAGRVLLLGEDLTRQPAHRRPVNTVFQNYALFPHLTVAQNIAFGLEAAGKSKSVVRESVGRLLEMVRLDGYGAKRPAQLSGGEKQRVAIARALVNQPKVLLLDEPLAALDLKLRQHLLLELRALHSQVDTTFIYVTHDQGEAMSLSHRIAVLHAGKVEQIGTPREIYDSPKTAQVAAFIGDTNFLPVTRAWEEQGQWRAEVPGLGQIRTSPPPVKSLNSLRISVRPQNLRISMFPPNAVPPGNMWEAVVTESVYFGTHTLCLVEAGGHRLTVPLPQEMPAPLKGSTVWLGSDADDTLLLNAAPGPSPSVP
ncbi:MAG: Spermidine/putrescine import ATP-binding protein PotA [Verrucomicrobiales bacterium]|nr:Spermidine/putrescine import ATP-binding protein PotA [Verrucomicrobiales bacterium]